MSSDPRLTPPIVNPSEERPKRSLEIEDTPEVLNAPPAALSPAEVEKGLTATLTKQKDELEYALIQKKTWSTKVTELRAGIVETERWLRAATPRTRKSTAK